jgi:hypothetical protein
MPFIRVPFVLTGFIKKMIHHSGFLSVERGALLTNLLIDTGFINTIPMRSLVTDSRFMITQLWFLKYVDRVKLSDPFLPLVMLTILMQQNLVGF